MQKANAAEIMAQFLWNKEVKKILKVEFRKNGEFEITQESKMKFLFAFQDFLEQKQG